MPLTSEYGELCEVSRENVFNFWTENLQESMGAEEWRRIGDPTGIYLAGVLGYFCLHSEDRVQLLSANNRPDERAFRRFADLSQVAEMMMCRLSAARHPSWMEAAGAHILLYAGFFHHYYHARYNIKFFSKLGKECYLGAAVGQRQETMKLMAREFEQSLFHLFCLRQHLEEKKYLITFEH